MTTSSLVRHSERSLAAGVALVCTLTTLVAQTYDNTVLAGTPGQSGFRDGRGSEARLLYSSSGTLDGSGNLYVAEAGAIRRITPAGDVTTVAGDGTGGYGYLDDQGRNARFTEYQFPIAADAAGNVYAVDRNSHTLRRITPGGEVTTLAGLAGARGYVDGRGAAARFSEPAGIAVDRDGRIYVSDSRNRVIRRITPSGDVTTFAGQIDPVTQTGAFASPAGLAFDGRGVLYVEDTGRFNTLSAISPEGRVTVTRWGQFGDYYAEESRSLSFKVDRNGNLLVHRENQQWITRLTPEGVETSQLHPAAPPPTGQRAGDLGLLAVDPAGAVYLYDQFAIRKHTPVAAPADIPAWSDVTLTAEYALSGVTYGNGLYVLAGSEDFWPSDSAPNVYTSPDGITWTRRHAPAHGAAFPPRFAGGRFFVAVRASVRDSASAREAAGDTVILSSSDGVNWSSSGFITRGNVPVDAPVDFAYGNGTFVAVSDTRTNAYPVIFTSNDGVSWIPRSIDGAAGPAPTASITFFRGHFYLAAWSGQLLRSVDGIEWTRVATSPAGPRYLSASADAMVVVAFDGTSPQLWLSSDGESFTTVAPDAGRIFGPIQFLDGTFVTAEPEFGAGPAATSIAIRASHDGRTWTTVARVATKDGWNLDVAPGGGSYVVTAGLKVYTGATELTPGGIPARRGHLRNISIRARAGPGADALIAGVTLADASVGGTTNLLVRGVAPALAQFGVTDTLADPQLRWMNQSTVLTANNDWNGDAAIVSAASVAGAFALPTGSKDAALLLSDVRPGSYTVHVTGHDDRTGVALAEVYALPVNDPTSAPRFRNFSARAPVGTGSELLVAGFEVHGGETQLLIRALGPALEPFGIPGFLGNPQLALYRGATRVAANDNWNFTTIPNSTLSRVGAVALQSGSTDAALITTLPPGTYTVQVSGVDGVTGVALFEVFVLR
jgi:sugar lactone lactonase YvrE